MPKAFDGVKWNHLLTILQCLGFSTHWCNLIKSCISSTTFYVHNGIPFGEFKPSRGIREGEALSPYLYILASDGLTIIFSSTEEKDTIVGVKIARDAPSITHLLFADYLFVFSKVDVHVLQNLKGLLRKYEIASGQSINL